MIAAYYFKEFAFAKSFLITGVFIFVITSALIFILRKFLEGHEVKLKHTVICLALAWIIISVTSMFPFLQEGVTPVNAFFESLSGWTGSGYTMFEDPSTISPTINFFRGYIQWVGGFGIVILALLLYAKPITAQRLFLAEGRSEDFFLDFKKIARIVVMIFFVYTLLGTIALTIAGVPLFDALIHTLTTISTGGYSTNTIGIGTYGVWPMFIGIILMLIGAISFNNHYQLLNGNFKKFFKNPELIFMSSIIIISTIIIFTEIWIINKTFFYDGFFYVISALSGTGAGTPLALTSFNQVSIVVLIFLMVCGAGYGSTSGAIKLWRILIIEKVIRREVVKHFLPEHAVVPIKISDQIVNDEQALKVTAYALLYLSLLFVGSLVFMLAGYSVIDSIFTVASAQGNVGLNILPSELYFNMNPLLKLLLTFHMLLGRMEIFPFLILLKSLKPSKF